ncbi:amidohydrolase family protein [Natrarchaeobius sp. A-rgal3]|uniref:amidohydrolase family protein n=1 Tax=Natrarchaeobius versutus TaxID=1679078 RepID=UPI00350F0D33
MEISGTILYGDQMEPIEGTVIVNDGRIEAVREESVDSTDIVHPAFVNAHTHIADSIAKEAGRGLSVKEVVEPPDGLKHRILADATRDELARAMRNTAEYMARSGTGLFADFRENGVSGVEALRTATEPVAIESFVLGRGETTVLPVADGYGASVVGYRDFEPARAAANEAEKPFGIHAGERNANDIDDALALRPDFLVHMVHARPRDLRTLADEEIPVVVCPRSNLTTDTGIPPVEELVDTTSVALGTDNVMLNSASMWREMEFTSKLYDVTDTDVLRMATVNGARLLGRDDIGSIEEGKRARLVVLDTDRKLRGTRDPVASVVRRAGSVDITEVIFDGESL